MLPEFEAIAFRSIIEKGAHTKPWLIEVDCFGTPTPYVVKLYTTDQNNSRNSTTAEVIGNIISSSFELSSPKAAFIHFPEDLRMKLPLVCNEILDNVDDRIKFGTEYIDSNFPFIPNMPKSQFSKHIDIDTLYAFDNFIRNSDRGDVKPNILLVKNGHYLIDHEMAFDIDENTIQKFNELNWEDKFGRYHIALNYLKRASKERKRQYFGTFLEYLRLLNINQLIPYFNQLENYGFSSNKELIIDYLEHIKQNSNNFVKILLTFIK